MNKENPTLSPLLIILPHVFQFSFCCIQFALAKTISNAKHLQCSRSFGTAADHFVKYCAHDANITDSSGTYVAASENATIFDGTCINADTHRHSSVLSMADILFATEWQCVLL